MVNKNVFSHIFHVFHGPTQGSDIEPTIATKYVQLPRLGQLGQFIFCISQQSLQGLQLGKQFVSYPIFLTGFYQGRYLYLVLRVRGTQVAALSICEMEVTPKARREGYWKIWKGKEAKQRNETVRKNDEIFKLVIINSYKILRGRPGTSTCCRLPVGCGLWPSQAERSFESLPF